jgi:hypothetical protein
MRVEAEHPVHVGAWADGDEAGAGGGHSLAEGGEAPGGLF